MPANHGFRAHDGDGVQQRREGPGDGGHGEAVTDLEPRAWGGPLEDDDLLAEQRVRRDGPGARLL
jgi:hypothetical protein